jgi:hypothetical protein
MKVALIFWGLTRSLKYTIKSIQQNILNVLSNNQIEYEIFMHTYKIDGIYSNKHAFERPTKLDPLEYKLLNPNFIIIDNQEKIIQQLNIDNYKKGIDPWNNNYQTLQNFILALYSKNRIITSYKDKLKDYQYIFFVRPDVLYLRPFDLSLLKKINNINCLIPDFSHNGGINDRMYVSSYNNAIKYGCLFQELGNYKFLHSETILKKYLEKYKINIILIDFKFIRIRVNGRKCLKDNFYN